MAKIEWQRCVAKENWWQRWNGKGAWQRKIGGKGALLPILYIYGPTPPLPSIFRCRQLTAKVEWDQVCMYVYMCIYMTQF